MIFSCRANSLEPSKYNDKSVSLEQITECPMCKTSLSPLHLNTIYWKSGSTAHIESHQFCTSCNHSFIGSYTAEVSSGGGFVHEPKLVSVAPQKFKEVIFDKFISGLSPQFTKIYNQALAAENAHLDEIAGLGYRKSLEFLIKDFAIHEVPADEDKIKSMPLAQCIKNYIKMDNIKTLAERSAWIGNDEAHYIRKQEDRDVSDMKSFIQATVYFIGMVLITEDAASMSPK